MKLRPAYWLAPILLASAAHAVQPVPGYACMALNITEAQAFDPNFSVPILATPDGPKLLNSASVVFVRQPSHIVHGYAEVLTLTGKVGWIARDMVKPNRGQCRPARLPDGRIEIVP